MCATCAGLSVHVAGRACALGFMTFVFKAILQSSICGEDTALHALELKLECFRPLIVVKVLGQLCVVAYVHDLTLK